MIENKIDKSGLVNIDPEDFYQDGKRMHIDIKDWLWQGQILREKDFRDKIATHNWEDYSDAYVSVSCSEDAIIPVWAYMLIGSKLEGVCREVYQGTPEAMETWLFGKALSELNPEEYRDKLVLIKGCSNKPVPPSAYLELTRLLKPFVRSLMYGEACSTVPVYKAPKTATA